MAVRKIVATALICASQPPLALKQKYPDPLYWGAFICQGDPGPLEGMK
jgi:CHAT domain-containing protein